MESPVNIPFSTQGRIYKPEFMHENNDSKNVSRDAIQGVLPTLHGKEPIEMNMNILFISASIYYLSRAMLVEKITNNDNSHG